MDKHIAVVALLRIRPEKRTEFNTFESRACEVAARHGGALERRIAFDDDHDWSEMHTWGFPDLASFEAYRADPDLAALAPLRAEAITDTIMMKGRFAGSL